MLTDSKLQPGEQQLPRPAPDLLAHRLPIVIETHERAAAERSGDRILGQCDVHLEDALHGPVASRIVGQDGEGTAARPA